MPFQSTSVSLKRYKIAIAIDPEDAKAHSNLGMVYLQLELYEKALDEFNKALVIDPYNGAIIEQIETVKFLMKKVDK